MAKRKTSEAFEKSKLPTSQSGPTRTELRNEESSERESEMNETRNRVSSFLDETDGRNLVQSDQPPKPATEPAPAGGKVEETKSGEKPPIAQTGPASEPEPGKYESMEQFDARLESIQAPKGQESNVRGIKQAWRKEHELVLEKDGKVRNLETQIKELESKIPPDEEMTRLRECQKIVETQLVEHLPKWKTYDEAATKLETEVVDMLKGFGVPDTTLESIGKRGGIAAFAASKKPAGSKFKNDDGSQMTEAEWFEKYIVDANKLTQPDRTKLFSVISKVGEKHSEKDRELSQAREKASETLKTNAENFREGATSAMKSKLVDVMKQELPRFEYPLEKPKILATDSAEEKKEKEGLIERWDKADKFISEAATAMVTTALKPEYAAEFAFKVAFYDEVMTTREKDQKKIKDLEARVEDLQTFKDSVKNSRRLPKTPIEPKKEETPKLNAESSAEDRVAAWAGNK